MNQSVQFEYECHKSFERCPFGGWKLATFYEGYFFVSCNCQIVMGTQGFSPLMPRGNPQEIAGLIKGLLTIDFP